MRVSLLASDYDGTLAPLEVRREESRVPPPLDAILRGIAETTTLAVVTSKSFDFISKRIPYAHAWGCVGGLEVRLRDGRKFAVTPQAKVEPAFEEAKSLLGHEVLYETKMGPTGMLGFAVDWRGRPTPTKLDALNAAMIERGLVAVSEPGKPFVDFFGARPDKGAALARIKEALVVSGSAIFLGDSTTDNSAFWQVDTPIGVDHGQALSKLECEFVVSQDEVTTFLKALTEAGMEFDPALPGVRRRVSVVA